jgi:hypothetical protein
MKKLTLAAMLVAAASVPALAQNRAEEVLKAKTFSSFGECNSSLSSTTARVRQDVRRGNDTQANLQRFEQAFCTMTDAGMFIIQFPE